MSKVHRFPHWVVSTASIAIAVFSVGHGRADAPVGRYTITNGTVLDTKTGLLWQQTISGTSPNWNDAKTYCQGLNLNGAGWRVPSVKELQTIVDESKTNPAIDPTAFPSTPSSYFWTSSPLAADPSDAWLVHFYFGDPVHLGVAGTNRVRCVR